MPQHVEQNGLVFNLRRELDERQVEIVAELDDALRGLNHKALRLEHQSADADGAHGAEKHHRLAFGEVLQRVEARDDELAAFAPVFDIDCLEHHGAGDLVIHTGLAGDDARSFKRWEQQDLSHYHGEPLSTASLSVYERAAAGHFRSG